MYTIWTGERVRLRPFKDEKEWCDMQEQLHLIPNDYWGAWWHPRARLKKDFEEAGLLAPGKCHNFAIERLDSGEAVGFEECGSNTGVTSINGWVGTFILPAHWHNGFGVEAKLLAMCYLFENYPYIRVGSGTLANHKRAASGLHNCGMQFVGRIRGVHYTNGKYHDIVEYSISREQWQQLPIRQIVKRG